MKNNITKKVFQVFAVLVFIGFASSVLAATVPQVYVSPTGLTKNVNESFVVNTSVSASENKVYAVEGTINFKNLACEKITVADGMMAQSTPTCAKPYFLIGIPTGTNKDTVLFSMTVKGIATGDATITFTNVDSIGEGKSISDDSTAGTYTINNYTATSGSYTGGRNLVGSKILTGPTVTAGSKLETGSNGSKTTLDGKTATEEVEANSQVASAGMSISNISIIWILFVIILMLLIYIFLRERQYQKNTK